MIIACATQSCMSYPLLSVRNIIIWFVGSMIASRDDISGNDVYMRNSRIVKQPGDHSCLFHSLSFCLSYGEVVAIDHNCNSGFLLRELVASFIRENGDVIIQLSDGLYVTIEEAVIFEGFSLESYFVRMSNRQAWGGTIEIAAVAEMYNICINIFRPVKNRRSFGYMGSHKCRNFGSESMEISLLYTGNCHYDSLVDVEFGSSYFEALNVIGIPIISQDELLSSSTSISLKRSVETSGCLKVTNKRKVKHSYKYNCLIASNATKRQYLRKKKTAVSVPRSINIVSPSPSRRVFILPKRNAVNAKVKRSKRAVKHKKRWLSISETNCNRKLRKEKRDLYRDNNLSPFTSDTRLSRDAAQYSKNYDDETRFVVCAICGVEGSKNGSKSIDECLDIIKRSGIKEKYESLTKIHTYSNIYDKLFIEELRRYFVDGLIKGCTYICAICLRQMKAKSIPKSIGHRNNTSGRPCAFSYSDDSDSDSSCESLVVEPTIASTIPKLALFNGKFTGSVPLELTDLAAVEDSMINIYSAITKMNSRGGTHYKVTNGTCYTIVDDLANVAKSLPSYAVD